MDVWERMIAVNSTGPFLMARAAVPGMIENGWGRVIGVTTSLGTMTRNIPYGPSKATHEAMVAAMARELEGTGVTANALLPGGGTNTMFVDRDPSRDFAALVQPEVMARPPSGSRPRNRMASTACASSPTTGTRPSASKRTSAGRRRPQPRTSSPGQSVTNHRAGSWSERAPRAMPERGRCRVRRVAATAQ